jgi:hypothetical protein
MSSAWQPPRKCGRARKGSTRSLCNHDRREFDLVDWRNALNAPGNRLWTKAMPKTNSDKIIETGKR